MLPWWCVSFYSLYWDISPLFFFREFIGPVIGSSLVGALSFRAMVGVSTWLWQLYEVEMFTLLRRLREREVSSLISRTWVFSLALRNLHRGPSLFFHVMRGTNTQGLEKSLGGFCVLNNYNPHKGHTHSSRGGVRLDRLEDIENELCLEI